MILENYDYNLPDEKIAQKPAEPRDSSRLLILNSVTGSINHSKFMNLPDYLEEGDLLILNNTKVFPARLIGKKSVTGAQIEIFLLRPGLKEDTWEALSRPAKKLTEGTEIIFGENLLKAKVIGKGADGHVTVKLTSSSIPDIGKAIDLIGKTPLPPYIKHEPDEYDRNRYQTVYAKEKGAVAAPTAGLHFTEESMDIIRKKGILTEFVTLHVGIGTFRPLTETEASKENLHSEYCRVPENTANKIIECRARKNRVVAIGTTTARALESASLKGSIAPYEGWTDIFIKPPYSFKSVDALVTNFHLPQSSLLMMVCAFAGREKVFKAYQEAIQSDYRFYSYGDAMLIFGAGQ